MHPTEGAVVVLDPGAPVEIGREVPAAPATPAKVAPTPEQTRIAELEASLREQREAAQFWANRARGGQPAPVDDAAIDDEPAEPVLEVANPPAGESTDDFLTDLNAAGLEALKKRGVITGEQLAVALQNLETRIRGEYAMDVQARQFDSRLSAEFPELIEANARVDAGQPANSPLFEKTAANYRALMQDAPGVKHNSAAGRSLMLAAARMAKTQLEAAAVDTNVDPAPGTNRRDRVEGQPGRGRARAGGADTQLDAPPEIGETSRAIIANLQRFGVTEARFKEFQGSPFERRNGRG
jgi:hypothetical protein